MGTHTIFESDFDCLTELNANASEKEIKKGFLYKAKVYHPDNQRTGNPGKFKEVKDALDYIEKHQYHDETCRQSVDKSYENFASGTPRSPGPRAKFNDFEQAVVHFSVFVSVYLILYYYIELPPKFTVTKLD